MNMIEQNTSVTSFELVSDLADGRLGGAALAQAVAVVASNKDSAAAWHIYHLIGDAMRSPELAGRCLDQTFADRVQSRIEREPLGPGLGGREDLQRGTGEFEDRHASGLWPAANDWNWSLVAGLGSLAVAVAVAWTLGGDSTGGDRNPQLSQARPSAPQAVTTMSQPEPQVMIRDPRLDELLAAHKQFGGASALQKPAGFLRNATFEEGSR